MRVAGEAEIDFIANIPQQIEADWNENYAHLAGFPLNIMFTGIRQEQDGSTRMVAACYWFDPGSYREDKVQRQMTYTSRKDGRYHLKVTFKRTGMIETIKYKGRRLVRQAKGDSFERAMVHATMGRMEPDETEDISAVLGTR
jgi:hypothetical protein